MMEVLTKTQRRFKLLAGLLGIIQGLAWILMAAICATLYMQDRQYSLVVYDSYMDLVRIYIYTIFIHGQFGLTFGDQLLVPNVFHICVWIYIVINIFWVFASFNVIFNQRTVSVSMQVWCVITVVICLCDFIMMVILGTDYQKCVQHAKFTTDRLGFEMFCANGILPVLMIAAKGFVLWIQNVAFIIILYTISTRLKQANVHVVPSYVFPQVATNQFHSVQSQPNFQQTNAAYSPQQQYPATPSSPYVTPNNFAGYPGNSPTAGTTANRMWNLPNGAHSGENFPNSVTYQNWGPQGAVMSGPNHSPFVHNDNPRR